MTEERLAPIQLSRRERQVMDIVHRIGEATVNEGLDALPDPPSSPSPARGAAATRHLARSLAVVAALVATAGPASPAPAPAPAPEGWSYHGSIDTEETTVGYFAAPRFDGLCGHGLVSDRAYGTIVNQHDDETTIRLLAGRCKLTIEMAGDVELRPDARGIRRMARGATLTIVEHAGRIDRELVVGAGANGVPQYRWSVDGERREIDDAARAWFRGVLVEIFRSSGLQARERVAWLLGSGGVPAVVDEVRQMPSDHTTGLYLSEALRVPKLTASQAVAILELAGESIGSDHDLSELIQEVPSRWLSDRAVQRAYVEAARSIGSDHDASEVLLALLQRELDEQTLDRLMAIADDIGSDHDAAEVLLALIDRYPPGAPMPPSFYRVAEGIGSDHDLAEVLLRTVDRGRTDEATLTSLLEVAEGIGSDHDLAEVLVRVAETVPLDGALRARFLETAKGVGSSYDHERVLAALD